MKPFIQLQLLFVLLAVTFIVAAAFVTVIAPLFGIGVRMLIASGLMIAYLAWRGSLRIERRDWWLFGLMGLIHIAIPYAGEFWALQFVSPIKVTFIWNMAPFMTALAALALYGQHLTRRQWVGMTIGFAGFVPMLHGQMAGLVDLFSIGLPEAILLCAVAASSVAWLVFAQLLERGYGPLLINAVAMVQGGLWCLALSAFTEPWGAGLASNWPLAFVYMAILIVAANFVCYNLYGRMLRTYSATFMAFTSQLIAFYTAIIGWFMGDTFLSWQFWASFAVVAVGLYLFCYPSTRTPSE